MTQLAHAGDWLTTLAFTAPIVLFMMYLLVQRWRERRRDRRGESDDHTGGGT